MGEFAYLSYSSAGGTVGVVLSFNTSFHKASLLLVKTTPLKAARVCLRWVGGWVGGWVVENMNDRESLLLLKTLQQGSVEGWVGGWVDE